MRKLLILGGHGDGLVAAQIALDMIRAGADLEFCGFLNDGLEAGQTINEIPVLGKTRDWSKFDDRYVFHVSLHKVGQMRARTGLIEGFSIPLERLQNLIHPTSVVAPSVAIGRGVLMASYVTVQPGAKLGNFGSIRAGANIGHDVTLGDFAYLGPNATLCGCACLGKGSHAGPNSVVVDGVRMGEFSVLSAGAVAFKDTDDDSTWIGNPARRAK